MTGGMSNAHERDRSGMLLLQGRGTSPGSACGPMTRNRPDREATSVVGSILVAERDGSLLGYAFFEDSFNSDNAARGVWLLDLFVRESARRHGIGQGLLAATARETLARGGKSLLWGVMSANAGARAFYAGIGARDDDARILELDGAALTELAQAARE